MQLSAPLTVLFDINSSCQLRCRYCSSMPFDGTDAPTERTITLLQEICELQIWYLNFSGGEPLLHPGIMQFIETVSQNGIEPLVNTNGLRLLDDSVLDELMRLHAKGIKFRLSISYDSPDPNANDTGRGRGEEVAEAIYRATSAGLNFQLSSVVHAGTLDTALNMPKVFKNAKSYTFFPMLTTWATKQRAEHLVADERFMDEFWKRATALQQIYGESVIKLPFRKHDTSETLGYMDEKHSTCFCSFTKCFIDSHLNVYPCDVTRTPSLCMGNLINSTLQTVWNSPEAHFIRETAKTERLCQTKLALAGTSDLPIRYKS